MTSTALSSPRQARAGGRTRGGIIGGRPGYWLLRRLGAKAATTSGDATAYAHRSKLEVLLGKDVWETVASKVVIDFGCGNGDEALEIARRGAARVIGVDIREAVLADARRRASAEGLTNCVFDTATDEHADVILSLDAFEHFDDPAGVLRAMRDLLKPDGFVLAAFGPTWLHPLGGHLFSVFPWAHLIFTEQALLRWRSDFKIDGARRFREVEGGLNQLTIRKFERIVDDSPFTVASLELVPIRGWRFLVGNRLTREFFTSVVRCRLVPRA